jgi:transposase
MSEPSCPGCRQRDATIAGLLARLGQLEQRVRELEARLGQNSSNSSLPPSADPPDAPKPAPKKPSGRKTGAQPGHEPRTRDRLPPEQVDHVIPLVPSHCRNCQTALPHQPGPDDPPPTRHQVAELPRRLAVVTEFQGHHRTCPCCGAVNHHPIPAELKAHVTGPRLGAALAYLAGCRHTSRRGLGEVCEALLGVPVSVGTVCAVQQQVSDALAQPHEEIAQRVRAAAVKNVDETGWKQAGKPCWLWAAVTATALLFVIHRRRGQDGLRALLGEGPSGVVASDRWGAYRLLPLGRRQLCWAHLLRDFQGMVDRGGEGAAVGDTLLFMAGLLFDLWYKVRDGTRTRRWLCGQVEGWLRPDLLVTLRQGAGCGCAKTAGMCAEILKEEEALWTFCRAEGLEPTNNAVERALRPAVLWRKGSFGSWSEGGCRFVERMLSVTQTLRLGGRSVLDYLAQALDAHRYGLPAPHIFNAA